MYLKHLDPFSALHSYIATAARLFLTRLDLAVHANHHKESEDPQSDQVFKCLLAIIEYTYTLQNDPRFRCWSWQISGRKLPWYAIHGVLKRLASYKAMFWEPGLRENAWMVIQRSLENVSEEEKTDPRYEKLVLIVRGQIGAVGGHAAITVPQEEGTGNDTVLTWTEAQFGSVLDGTNDSFADEVLDWQGWDAISGESAFHCWDNSGF